MKKYLLILSIVIVLFLLIGGGFFLWRRHQASQTGGLETEGVLIETILADRPFISLTPSSDGHWLTIDVSRIKEADSLEYELLYDTVSGATQGSINTVPLNGESTYSKKILLGSESSGKFKYDEGVTQGILTIRLRGGPGTRKFVTEFHLQKGDEELTSIDNNFIISGTIPTNNYYVTMNTVGLPGEFDGEVFLGPYASFSSGTESLKNGLVSFTFPEENAEASLYSWSGTEWTEEKAEIENKTISTTITSLTTFIVTSVSEASE
jgi:hypothetical protein